MYYRILKVCEFCKKKKMLGRYKRFCSHLCAAKWRTSPGIKELIYTPERFAKGGATQRRNGKKLGKPSWNKGIQCRPATKRKLSESHKKTGHTFKIRGGNGRPLTVPQQTLLDKLGSQWKPEHAIALGGRQPNYPTCYKVDLALVEKKLAIECDGSAHGSQRMKNKDAKKDKKLTELGWRVLRLKNETVLSMCTTLNSKALRISLLKMF